MDVNAQDGNQSGNGDQSPRSEWKSQSEAKDHDRDEKQTAVMSGGKQTPCCGETVPHCGEKTLCCGKQAPCCGKQASCSGEKTPCSENEIPVFSDGKSQDVLYKTDTDETIDATITIESKMRRAFDDVCVAAVTSSAFFWLFGKSATNNAEQDAKTNKVVTLVCLGMGAYTGVVSWCYSQQRLAVLRPKKLKPLPSSYLLGSACFFGCLGAAGYYLSK